MVDNDSNSQIPLAEMPPVGTEIDLPSGSILQTPNPDTLDFIQAADARVRYFPSDMERVREAGAGYEYYRGVADVIGKQIQQDFPGERVAVRGTVAALTEGFPFWPADRGSDQLPLTSVTDILRTGNDAASETTRVGFIEEDGELNDQTHEWLTERFSYTAMDLELEGATEKLAKVFPVLIVYREGAFKEGKAAHGWNDMAGKPEERVAAVYVTDKILRTNRPDKSPETARMIQQNKLAKISLDDLF